MRPALHTPEETMRREYNVPVEVLVVRSGAQLDVGLLLEKVRVLSPKVYVSLLLLGE